MMRHALTLIACLAVVLSARAVAAEPGTVTGKLTYKGEDYPLKHVYAWQPPGQAEELWVYLTDTELPAAAAQRRSKPAEVAAENRFRGVKLRLNPTKPNRDDLSFVLFASADDRMEFGASAPGIWQVLGVGNKLVVGKLKYEASDDTSLDVEFNAPVFSATRTRGGQAVIEMDMIVPEDWPAVLAIGGVGLVLLVVGYIKGSRRRALSRAEVTTQGRVVRQVEERDHEGGRTTVYHHPEVEFASSDGATHRFISYNAPPRHGAIIRDVVDALKGRFTERNAPKISGYDIGSTVNVRYDPENPSTARIPGVMNSSGLWQGIVLIWLFGLGVMAFAIMFFFASLEFRVGNLPVIVIF